MRNIYSTEPLVTLNAYNYVANKSLFSHNNGTQTRVGGLINNESNKIWLEIVSQRSIANLKKFMEKYVKRGIYIITDNWLAYTFLDFPNIGYVHYIHIHGDRDFV